MITRAVSVDSQTSLFERRRNVYHKQQFLQALEDLYKKRASLHHRKEYNHCVLVLIML